MAALLGDEGMGRVRRKKDFCHMEKAAGGRAINVLQGLELHTAVFSPEEQKAIVACVLDLQDQGRRGLLKERTYSEPRKWMRGKGRATIQFGCCYNYAADKAGNPPGILRDNHVDPLPPLLSAMVRRLVLWRVLPPSCVPDSCIVNIYDKDDCIPPHVDSHDFLRPFCTASFLAECAIVFGRELRVVGPGEFAGAASIPLPAGSVLVLKGNGADVAKHCVPAVPAKRISITFRKMDPAKVPFGFSPDPVLQKLAPLPLPLPPPPAVRPAMAMAMAMTSAAPAPQQQQQQQQQQQKKGGAGEQIQSTPRQQAAPLNQAVAGQRITGGGGGVPFSLSADEFPALGASPAGGRRGRR